jgi:hypothetical protein
VTIAPARWLTHERSMPRTRENRKDDAAGFRRGPVVRPILPLAPERGRADIKPAQKGERMKEPEDMTIADMRAELRAMGVTERLSLLILREMGEAERRIEQAQKGGNKGKYDPLRAQLYILKAHGMTNPDLSLNRKGKLFIQMTTREEEMGPSAQSA